MIQYSAEELLNLRKNDVTVPRAARKVIFRYRLWLPVKHRRLLRIDQPRSRGRSPVVLSTNNNQLIVSCANGCWTIDDRRDVFPISTLVNSRPQPARRTQHHRRPVLRRISTAPAPSTSLHGNGESPVLSLYVLNAARLTKQHAVEHLASDLNGVDAAVASDTHFGAKHADNIVSIPDYRLFRRDRSICNARGRRMKAEDWLFMSAPLYILLSGSTRATTRSLKCCVCDLETSS